MLNHVDILGGILPSSGQMISIANHIIQIERQFGREYESVGIPVTYENELGLDIDSQEDTNQMFAQAIVLLKDEVENLKTGLGGATIVYALLAIVAIWKGPFA